MGGKKRVWFVMVAAAFLAGSVGTVWAQAGQPGFLAALLEQLGKNGWTVQERSAFAEAAAAVDWSPAEGADPEAVALALRVQEQDQLRTQDQRRIRDRLQLTEAEQAETALQLALMTREMAGAGFDRHDTALAAAAAMRSCLGDLQAWMEGGRHGELGQILRMRVRAAVLAQVVLAARSQAAGSWSGDRAGSGPGAGPSASGGMQGAGGPPLGHGGGR